MYAIIDIETTGGSSRNDRITEIAIFLHDGNKVIDQYVTLINPERRIPYRISMLTGISDEMVSGAPKFYQVAKKVVEMTEGAVFVAHNVNFDFNFIKEEFRSLGFEYKREKYCTVKMSRKLMPGLPSYSLGKLCGFLGIENKARHRAAGDALATVKLLEHLFTRESEEKEYAAEMLKDSPLRELVKSLPKETGCYYFYDLSGNLIYIGKSINIRSRVLSHFSNNVSRKSVEMVNHISNIQYKVTGSELVALLKESEEIKKHKPFYNRAGRRAFFNTGLFAHYDSKGYLNFKIDKMKSGEIPLTAFTTKREAEAFLHIKTEEFELCQKLTGLYKVKGPCFHHAIKKCRGACIEEENAENYNFRAMEVVKNCRFEEPNFMIVDKGRNLGEKAVVLVEKGKYYGYGFVPDGEEILGNSILKQYIHHFQDNRSVQQMIRYFIANKKVEQVLEISEALEDTVLKKPLYAAMES